MALEVQKFLRKWLNTDVALHELNKAYGINSKKSPIGESLVILNYDQIESSAYKTEKIVRECRGLVLNSAANWEVVAAPMFRFFNYSEVPHDEFDWNNHQCYEKVDGSLFIVYFWENSWRINTRNSFGQESVGDSEISWECWFYELIDQKGLDNLDRNHTYCFEFHSPYNQVVKFHPEPHLTLLCSKNRITFGEEIPTHNYGLGSLVKLPQSFQFKEIFEMKGYIENCGDKTFEGFVIVDKNCNRIKIKSPEYVMLSKIRGQNNKCLASPKNIVPFILKGETAELIAYWPLLESIVDNYGRQIDYYYQEALDAWSKHKNLQSQKEFAIAVTRATPLSSLLFQARKRGVDFTVIWKESEEFLTKFFAEKIKDD